MHNYYKVHTNVQVRASAMEVTIQLLAYMKANETAVNCSSCYSSCSKLPLFLLSCAVS
jgi:hypothetical protein